MKDKEEKINLNIKNKEEKGYCIWNFLSDIATLFLFFLICELCGCHVFSFIGESVGSAVKSYERTTNPKIP